MKGLTRLFIGKPGRSSGESAPNGPSASAAPRMQPSPRAPNATVAKLATNASAASPRSGERRTQLSSRLAVVDKDDTRTPESPRPGTSTSGATGAASGNAGKPRIATSTLTDRDRDSPRAGAAPAQKIGNAPSARKELSGSSRQQASARSGSETEHSVGELLESDNADGDDSSDARSTCESIHSVCLAIFSHSLCVQAL